MHYCNQYASNRVDGPNDLQVAELIKKYPEILDLTFFVFCVDGKPQGIIFKHQILQLIERGENVWRVKLTDIMSKNFCTMVKNQEPLHIIDRLYRSTSNFIVFVDAEGQYVGVTTRSDIESELLPDINSSIFGHEFFGSRPQASELPSTEFDRIIASSFNIASQNLGLMIIDASYHIHYVNDIFKNILRPRSEKFDHLSSYLPHENDISSLFFAALDLLRQKPGHSFSFYVGSVQHTAILEKFTLLNSLEFICITLKTDDDLLKNLNTLKQFLFIDFLTSIPNRMYFEERFKIETTRARRNVAHAFALVVADINDFKQINDTQGHLVGDLLLQQVALRLKNAVRESDTVARYGGDEFVMILTEIRSRSAALATLQKISDVTNGSYVLDGEPFTITLSFGLSLFDGADMDTTFKKADAALYQAKQGKMNGGGHIVVG